MIYKPIQSKVKFQKYQEKEYLPFRHQGFSTKSIHEGQEAQSVFGSVNVPIHLSSTYAQKDIGKPYDKFDYTRCGNPTRYALQRCIAKLQYGTHCIVFASGCGATATLMHTLKTGDHVIVCDDVYGGTQRYMRLFTEQNHGIKCQFIDMTNVENIAKSITENTKMVWIQTPTNPTMKLIDIDQAIKSVKSVDPKILVVVDNTFASPYLQSPMLLGADVAYNSCSKYIGGHSDLIGGAIVYNDDILHKKLTLASNSIGANPSPFDCYLMLRGLKTLEQRVIQSTKNAFHIAHYMENNQFVQAIFYPGLKSSKFHEVAKKQMRGFGGIISFRVKGGKEQTSKFLQSLKIFTLAQSLGGVQSLAQCPYFMTHASVPLEVKQKLGITPNLVRLSAGIQSIQDLIQDIDQALKASQQ